MTNSGVEGLLELIIKSILWPFSTYFKAFFSKSKNGHLVGLVGNFGHLDMFLVWDTFQKQYSLYTLIAKWLS